MFQWGSQSLRSGVHEFIMDMYIPSAVAKCAAHIAEHYKEGVDLQVLLSVLVRMTLVSNTPPIPALLEHKTLNLHVWLLIRDTDVIEGLRMALFMMEAKEQCFEGVDEKLWNKLKEFLSTSPNPSFFEEGFHPILKTYKGYSTSVLRPTICELKIVSISNENT